MKEIGNVVDIVMNPARDKVWQLVWEQVSDPGMSTIRQKLWTKVWEDVRNPVDDRVGTIVRHIDEDS